MKKWIVLCVFAGFILGLTPDLAWSSGGLVTKSSDFSVQETADRFEAILAKKGLTLFARINHTSNAKNVDIELRPTEALIFGNPKVGTPLMLCAQSVAIDLPQKALIWEDESGEVWFAYNDPQYLKQRHGVSGCDEVINKITNVLSNLSNAAIKD